MSSIQAPSGMVDCPRCGGYPDCDESGRPYTCYFCCDAGWVTLATAQADIAEQEQERVARPRAYGYRDEFGGREFPF